MGKIYKILGRSRPVQFIVVDSGNSVKILPREGYLILGFITSLFLQFLCPNRLKTAKKRPETAVKKRPETAGKKSKWRIPSEYAIYFFFRPFRVFFLRPFRVFFWPF
uniref:hypothetical protein n=1 Tax=Cephaleuros karstenii TaxID=1985640 RepID=UPI001EDF19D4|nr:hypothetical protein MFR52_pgp094 [Cephaleuros karstenii]UIB39065.1 hypothetical protein [Cephaleuros karstenii]